MFVAFLGATLALFAASADAQSTADGGESTHFQAPMSCFDAAEDAKALIEAMEPEIAMIWREGDAVFVHVAKPHVKASGEFVVDELCFKLPPDTFQLPKKAKVRGGQIILE